MEELGPSELGTQEYWEQRYEDEIKNFFHNGDPGEIWFGEDILNRIINWMDNSNLVDKDSRIVDIGCGNGMLLVELAAAGYSNLTGLDYSEKGIELAKQIAEKHDLDITYSTNNILEGMSHTYDVIHDKGTYDAISLSSSASEDRLKYIENISKSLKGEGVFIITSCNWTQSELEQQFIEHFVKFETIPTPQFKFCGKVGNVVTSCVFKKK